ncbi:hypothetical protein [Oceanospirillum beijerinckii]|uniref:hypothetical protein n=1 Tax=Oceanospirillum beijerinckii TaxID=64976 RepID=UPI0004147536|nr:hypothetical protein [Oceanospirillum beijerinckii]MAC48514.1 phosphatase [Oceanospirillum sp.]
MSQELQQKAQDVVSAFKQQLSKSGIEHVGQHHFSELQLLIESALTSVSLQQMEHTADRVQSLAQQLRQEVQHSKQF